jgi:hypothetical protein
MIERTFSMKETIPDIIAVRGREYERDIAAEHAGRQSGDPWTNHWSLSIGARTDEHAVEIGMKCLAAKVECQFDKHLRLRVRSASHQRKLCDAIFGKGKIHNMDSYH